MVQLVSFLSLSDMTMFWGLFLTAGTGFQSLKYKLVTNFTVTVVMVLLVWSYLAM